MGKYCRGVCLGFDPGSGWVQICSYVGEWGVSGKGAEAGGQLTTVSWAAVAASGLAWQLAIRRQRSCQRMPSQSGRDSFVREPAAPACSGLGESLLRGKLKWKSASARCAALAGTKPSERSFSGVKRAWPLFFWYRHELIYKDTYHRSVICSAHFEL